MGLGGDPDFSGSASGPGGVSGAVGTPGGIGFGGIGQFGMSSQGLAGLDDPSGQVGPGVSPTLMGKLKAALGGGFDAADMVNTMVAATIPVAGPAMAAFGFGDLAEGDPASGGGVSGPDGGVGVGGGPESKTVQKIKTELSKPSVPVPAPAPPPAPPPAVDPDLKRKRIGREETIKAPHGLDDLPSLKPTLLGM